MKLLVYVLFALLVISCVSQADSESSCQELDPSQLETDAILKDAFDRGLKWLLQQQSDKYGIIYSNIEVTKINRICHWQVGNEIYNLFDVEFTNNEGANLHAVFTVNSKGDASWPPNVVKWNVLTQYESNSGETVQDETVGEDVEVEINIENLSEEVEANAVANSESNCQEVDPLELETNPLIRDAFDQGIKWVFRQAADEYGISSSNIEVTKVNRVCHWQVGNNIYNIFDVEATNGEAIIHAIFIVDCKDDDSALPAVIRSEYHIVYITEANEIGESETGWQEYDTGEDIEVEIESDIFGLE